TVETVQALTSDLGTTVKDWIASLPPTSAGSGSRQDQSANAPEHSGTHGGVTIAARDLPSYSPEGDVAAATTTQVAALDRARNAALEVEARQHVARLATPVAAPIAAAGADQFVAPDQIIELVPRPRTRRRTLAALARDEDLNADSPLTIVRRTERVEDMSATALIVESAGDMNSPVRVVDGNKVREMTLGQALREMRELGMRSLRVVRSVPRFETTTLNELRAQGTDEDAVFEIVDPADTPAHQVRLRDLLPAGVKFDPNSVFYVRTVTTNDEQGLWGLVQRGLTENFARGVAVNRGDRIETYAVDIPRHADEMRPDRRSSYLGRLIHAKTGQSYIYNLYERRMGRNPNDIHPGQEIVIINFSPEELIAIYKHFAGPRS
ncbi:MAG: hypothetical protein ACR2RL_03305, partial [Gammaproteobacteria bacterium]